MARTKADAARGNGAGGSSTSKGPLWSQFKDIMVGRVLQRADDGCRGVVLFPEHHVYDNKLAAFCMVRWDNPSGQQHVESVPLTDVMAWIADEFANEDNVPPHLLDYQENNWYPLDDSFKRARSPPQRQVKPHDEPKDKATQAADKTPGSAQATPTVEDAGPSSRARSRKQGEADAAAAAPTTSPRATRDTRGSQPAPGTAVGASGRKTLAAAASGGKAPAATSSRKRTAAAAAAASATTTTLSDAETEDGQAAAEQTVDDGETVLCVSTNRRLPADLCYRPGDKRLDEIGVDENDGDYVVERIMDEIMVGRKKHYLIKWQGFELNVGGNGNRGKGDWEPESNLRNCEALEAWLKEKPDWWLKQQNVDAAAKGRKKARPGRK